MAEEHESLLEHMPLEEVRIERIAGYEPPDSWEDVAQEAGEEPMLPPVLIERSDGSGFALLVHHRTVWLARQSGKLAVRALVVRSNVHIPVAHGSVGNCVEEALLFEGLLSESLVENRSRLADMLGYSRARITQVLNLLKLPDGIKQQLLLADEISEFQLRPLVRITDPKAQREAFSKLMEDNLTGRQMEKYLSEKSLASRDVSSAAGGEMLETVDATDHPLRPSSSGRGGAVDDIEELMEQEVPASAGAPEGSPDEPSSVEQGHVPGEKQREPGSRREWATTLRGLIRRLGPDLRDGSWEEEATLEGLSERDLLFLRGVGLMQRGLYDEAIDALTEVTVASPEHALAYYYLGRCKNLLGLMEEAEGFLRTAIDLIPTDPDMIADLAIVLEKQKRYEEATSCYRIARRLRKAAVAESRPGGDG